MALPVARFGGGLAPFQAWWWIANRRRRHGRDDAAGGVLSRTGVRPDSRAQREARETRAQGVERETDTRREFEI